MDYRIEGTSLPVVTLTMNSGESVFTESGGMSWYRGPFAMKTNMRGGFMAAVGRKLSGESLFMTTYECQENGAEIAFASSFPGAIIPLQLGAGQEMICQKEAFLCAADTVTLQMHFRKKLGAGLLGGEGFILQKLTGPGLAFAEISGDVSELVLKPGEKLMVDTGHIALYEPTVQFEIEMVKGVTNMLFGGEGLVLARMTGPGKVWLQSMPISNLAARLSPYLVTAK